MAGDPLDTGESAARMLQIPVTRLGPNAKLALCLQISTGHFGPYSFITLLSAEVGFAVALAAPDGETLIETVELDFLLRPWIEAMVEEYEKRKMN